MPEYHNQPQQKHANDEKHHQQLHELKILRQWRKSEAIAYRSAIKAGRYRTVALII